MGLSFSSCSDKSEYSYNPAPQVTNNYNTAFIKTFGQPAANQDWGFGQYAYARKMTRGSGSHPDSQNWGYPKYPNTMKLEEIPSITPEEVEAVLAVFNQEYDGPCESAFNWADFYVQHVWKGTASYTTKDGNTTVVGGEKMNWLCAYSKNGNDDQINNFKPEDGDIMLMLNSSTSRFGYKSEIDNGHVFYFYREVDDVTVDGNMYEYLDYTRAEQLCMEEYISTHYTEEEYNERMENDGIGIGADILPACCFEEIIICVNDNGIIYMKYDAPKEIHCQLQGKYKQCFYLFKRLLCKSDTCCTYTHKSIQYEPHYRKYDPRRSQFRLHHIIESSHARHTEQP